MREDHPDYHIDHTLKTDPEVFQAAMQGVKTWEIRKDDRGFKVGDILCLRETEYTGEEMKFQGRRDWAYTNEELEALKPKPLKYTGRELYMRVTYILRGPIYGLKEGWVIMSVVVP
jgi:hypothetical protein